MDFGVIRPKSANGGVLKISNGFNEIRRRFAFPADAKPWISAVGWGAAIGVVYFLASRLGHSLLVPPLGLSVFWPASGIAVGILITRGQRALPALIIGVMAGTIVSNLMSDRALPAAIFKGLCNVSEPVIVAWFLERLFGPEFSFTDLRRVLGFLTAAAVATAISAVGGAAAIMLLQTKAPYWDLWRVWFLSDGIGIVVVAPLLVEFSRAWRGLPSRRETIEGAAVLTLLALISTYVYAHPTISWISFDPDAFALPLLLWLAARWPPTFAVTGAFLVSVAAMATTIFGVGHLSDVGLSIEERVHGVQTTVMSVTVFTLVLVGLFAERRRSEETLKQSKDRLQLALDGAELGTFSANLITSQFECDTRTALLHGHNVPPATLRQSRRFVYPSDLVHIDTAMAEACRRGGSWNAQYRVLHPPDHIYAGETRWITVEASIVRDPQGAAVGLLGITRDITDRKRAEERQRTLNAELDHRVKNVLATVSTVAARTMDASSSMNHFVASLDGRIRSMARTHEMLSATQWHGICLRELIRRELAPYATSSNTEINGPDVILKVEAGQAMGMVLHELVTNAAKYGALTAQNGRVSIRWERRVNGHLHCPLVFEWREIGGPTVVAPQNSGFGTSTIRELIPYEFGGKVDLAFASTGVQCHLEFPGDWLIDNGEHPSTTAHHCEPVIPQIEKGYKLERT
jgi:two-component sensor histidine kinase/integral membrane sensor domain MASE1